MRSYTTFSRRRIHPCEVCHRPVDTSKPCVYIQPRCLDCAWVANYVIVFCSEVCGRKWTPPAEPAGHHHVAVD